MKQLNFLSKTRWLLLPLMLLTISVGKVWATDPTVTSTFTNDSWGVGSGEPAWTASSITVTGKVDKGVQVTLSNIKNAGGFTLTNNTFKNTTGLDKITGISLNVSSNGTGGSISGVTVGGTTFKNGTNNDYSVSKSDGQTPSFTHSTGAKGDIVISFASTATSKSLYIKSITITYTVAASCSNTPTMSFTPNSVVKTVGDANFTKTVSITGKGAGQTVAYSSSNTSVATVNSSTGEVTIKTNGSTTITASVAESGDYCSASASYTLTVNKPTHKVYFYNGSTLLNTGGTSVEEGASVTYSGSTPVSCDDGDGASSTFVGWATNTWTNKKSAKGDIPAGTTFYDVTASESLPNMSTDDVTYHAVFAKGTEVSTPVANTWTRITNVSQLTDGATVMLVQYYADKAINNTPGATDCTANAEITNSTANLRWIAEISGNKWKFKTSGGSYLSTSSLADQTALSLNNTYNEWSITDDASYSNCFNLNNGNDLEYYSSFKVYAYSSKYASAYPFYIYIQKTTTSTTYSNYMTTCCTQLGQINGSFSLPHPLGAFSLEIFRP